MVNNGVIKLPNGLRIIYYIDNKFHNMVGEIHINYGGMNNKYLYNNKLKTVNDGYAHLIEHLLLEHSKYGNVANYYQKKNIITNGFTSNNETIYFINTVYDFDKDFIKLIRAINQPCFTKEDVQKTKKAVIEEIRKNEDNKFRKLDILVRQNTFHSINYYNNSGTLDDINKINYEEIVKLYKTFYKPSNQTICIMGNIDINKIVKKLEKEYKNIIIDNKFGIPKFNEPDKVVNKNGSINIKMDQDYTLITYKINLDKCNYTNYEKVILTFYINTLLSSNFGESSKTYKTLIDKKISISNISASPQFIDNFLLLNFGTYTDQKNKFIKLIRHRINNLIYDKTFFESMKKQDLIKILLREESLYASAQPFIDNIISFGYDKTDTIEDIEKMNFKNYKKEIKKLYFKEYTINSIIGGNNGKN